MKNIILVNVAMFDDDIFWSRGFFFWVDQRALYIARLRFIALTEENF